MMLSKGMGSQDQGDQEDKDSMMGKDDSVSGKLLALQNMLDSLGDIVGDDLRPYIDELKQNAHLKHEDAEGDDMGSDEAEEGMEDDSMPPKEGMDISIGMGKIKPPLSDEEDDEGLPKKGFLAILSKKLKK